MAFSYSNFGRAPAPPQRDCWKWAVLIPNFIVSVFPARSNNGAGDRERQQEGSAGKADICKAFLISSVRSVIAKSQLRQIWVKRRKKKGGFLWKERKSQEIEAPRITLFLNMFGFAASSSHRSPGVRLLTTPARGSRPEPPRQGDGKGKKGRIKERGKKKGTQNFTRRTRKKNFEKLQVYFP